MNTRFAFAMARREARSSWRRLVLYGACMAIGISALVGLQGLRSTVRDAVDGRSRELLGADLLLSSRKPLGDEARALVDAFTVRSDVSASRITRFGSMALAPRSGQTRLVDVQGHEGGFPFYGAILTEPAGAWSELAGTGGGGRVALVDPSLLLQLDAEVGDELELGGVRFRIAAAVTRAPGTFGMRTQLAPRVFVPRRFIEETGLVQRGSLVEHRLYLRASAAVLDPWLAANRSRLEGERVNVQTVVGYQEDVGRSFGALTQYLGLVGLAALALGGIGVASGVRVFVREKLDTVAVLRSLGAQSRDVVLAYGLLALVLGAAAGGIGAVLGTLFQWVLPRLLSGFLPVDVADLGPRIEPGAIATGIAIGLWVTALFAIAPLLDLGRVPPLRALRRDFAAESAEASSQRGRMALVLALAASLLVASIAQAPNLVSGLGFAVGIGVAIALLAAAAAAAAGWLRSHRLRRAPFWLRQGVANLFRPRNHTLATTLAIGFGLFLVATLHAVQHNVLRQLSIDARPDRPNLVLFDVQQDQRADLEAFLAERDAAVIERAPIISARVTRVAGRSVDDWLRSDDVEREQRWALGREYRVTYTSDLREGEEIVAGGWWGPDESGDADGSGARPVDVSLEREIAASLDVGIGDRIGWSVQGVPVESVLRSIREVDWGRFGTNFFAIFPPGVLDKAPQSSVFLARLEDADARAALQRDLVKRFPNVSALDATVILRALDALMTQTGLAVRVVALFTVATGFMILIAAASAARHERTREALLLRTLGASRQTVRRILVSEAVALGLLASSVGTSLALVAGWALVHFVFEMRFAPPLLDLLGLALATVAITALVGAANGGPSAAGTPLAGLREAELSGVGAG